MGTVQFIFVALKPDTLADLQAGIAATGALSAAYNLTLVEYPIVLRENGDWAQYIDEYHGNPFPPPDTLPNTPGIAIIDQSGNFYAIRHNDYEVHAGIDWVVRQVDELLGGRRPVDTVLVLDRSGSMASAPPAGSTDAKLTILQDAVGVFLDLWEANAVAGDRVGVVDFSDTVSHYSQPLTGANLVPLATDVTAVRSYVDSLLSDGYTCMGGAAAEAVDMLAASARRHMILFSDGMQNYNPVFADVGYPLQILHVDPGDVGSYSMLTAIYGDSGIAPKPGQDIDSFDTHIHTIGVGLGGAPWPTLMSHIATQTDGLHFQTPAPAADLQTFYVNDLLDSFRGATPQIVQHTQGMYDSRETPILHQSCWINSGARWLTVVISWEGDGDRNRLLCNLEAPDGTLIEIARRTKVAERRLVLSLPLPPYHHDRLVQHAGRWQLHIMGTTQAATPYQVFWLVDDRHVHFDVSRFDKPVTVGDVLVLNVQLTEDGKPVGVDQVRDARVTVASPLVDCERFIAEYQVDPATLRKYRRKFKELDLLSEMEQKLYVLSQDAAAVARCTQVRKQSIRLAHDQDALGGSVHLTSRGIHRFDFYLNARDHAGHRIVRSCTRNVLVR